MFRQLIKSSNFSVVRTNISAFTVRDFSRLTGTVKWFDSTKGFGFIQPTDQSEDLFVHQTSIKSSGFRSLAEGETVEFDVVANGNKKAAQNVTGPNGVDVQGAPPGGRDGRGDGGQERRGGNRRDSY